MTSETILGGLTYVKLEFQKERRKGGQVKKALEEIIADIFPNLVKTINPLIQETQ